MTFPQDELPPLDRDIAELLASAERAPPSPAALHLRHHIRRRVGATVAGGAVVSAALAATVGTTSAADVGAATVGKAAGWAPLLFGKAKLALVVVGCASAGAVGYGYVNKADQSSQARRSSATTAPATYAAREPELPQRPTKVAAGTLQNKRPVVAIHPKASAPAQATDALLDEQRLLAQARAALADGQSDEAMASLRHHALTYPRGKLSEEREAMAVRVLVRLGRHDEARQRARAFVIKYPHSIQRPVVEATLQAPVRSGAP